MLQAENCKKYNTDKTSEYYLVAEKFEEYILTLFGKDEGAAKGGGGKGEAASSASSKY
jgi:hypothetical protein